MRLMVFDRAGRRRDPLTEIEVGIHGDTAAALGQAGRRLRAALDALHRGRDPERPARLDAAADALWAYVVQKELIGVTDHALVTATYGVTAEVWRRMGAMPRAAARS